MTAVSIVGGQCLTTSGLEALILTFEGDTITRLSPAEPIAAAPQEDPEDTAVIDASGLVVSPGLVDLQVNGGYGHDLQDDPRVVWDLGRKLPRSGVTSFLPTVISGPRSRTRSMLEALRARPTGYCGAEPLGAHFEGPMLNTRHSGAHRHEHLTGVSADVINGWHRSTGVTMVTIAPELADALDVIGELNRRGIVVAAGHSAATGDETLAAIAAGVSTVTHLFNGMAPLGHRSPNLVGVASGGHAPHRHPDRRRRARRPHRGDRGLERQGVRRHRPGDRRRRGNGAAARRLPAIRHSHRLRWSERPDC